MNVSFEQFVTMNRFMVIEITGNNFLMILDNKFPYEFKSCQKDRQYF